MTRLGGLNQAFNLTFVLSLAGALLVWFAREERQAAPRPSRLLTVPPHPDFWRAAAIALLVMGAFGTLLTVVPLEEQRLIHLPASVIGLLVALLTGTFAFGPLALGNRLQQRQIPPATAMALCLAGEVAAAAGGANPEILAVALPVLGTGLGIAYVNATAQAAGTTEEGSRGAVMGLFTVGMNLGYGPLAVLVVFLGGAGAGPLWVLVLLTTLAVVAQTMSARTAQVGQ